MTWLSLTVGMVRLEQEGKNMQFFITRSELVRRSKAELVVLKRAFEQAAAQHQHDAERSTILAGLAEIRRFLLGPRR